MTITHLWRHWLNRLLAPDRLVRNNYKAFRNVLREDGVALEILADLETHLYGHNPADHARVGFLCEQLIAAIGAMARHLQAMNPGAYQPLTKQHHQLAASVRNALVREPGDTQPPYIIDLEQAADSPELAGGKAANLSATGRAGIPIPKGFVITANAYHRFIRDNNLQKEFSERFRLVHADDNNTIIRITGELQELILAAEIPEEIAGQIIQAAGKLGHAPLLAVRSSALAEDGRVSFAGQYASELEVPVTEMLAAYKRVIAGKFCPRAVTYRIRHGLSDTDTAMAVLVVPMIEPRASGVVYTRDPATSAANETIGVYAVAGLAEGLVDGSRIPEKYYLSRHPAIASLSSNFTDNNTLLSEKELLQLGTWGMMLEHHFGCPQDIEWVQSDTAMIVLQCRRLQQKKDPPPAIVQPADLDSILYSDLHCAAAGMACGPVFHAPTGKAFRDIPNGAVVVTPTLRPALSQFLDRVAGVIAASGSRASHFASVARERNIPVLVGEGIELTERQVVTVDAASGRVFRGCVNALLQTGKNRGNIDFPKNKYTDLAIHTVHLNLTDPDSETFTPEHCRSMHDVVRYCHEKCVIEMFTLVGRKGRGLGKAQKLSTDLPLVMYVLDLDKQAGSRATENIRVEQISSLPMQACWQGMSDPKIVWDKRQQHVDWQEFDQHSGGIFALDSQLLASYAVVSREYLHLNIRFGYHFSIVDALCSEQTGTNYINFRFKGGGAAVIQQGYRLTFIDRVLTCFGFQTTLRGEMLDASLARASAAETGLALQRLGMLLAATRMMDMRLTNRQQALDEADKFIVLTGDNPS
jgi:pyruvate, water dikinase